MDIRHFLINFYSKHQNSSIIQFARNIYSGEFKFPFDLFAEMRLSRISKQSHSTDRKIRVCFISSEPTVWVWQDSVYREMAENSLFDVYILCIPNALSDDSDATYNFFLNKEYNCVNSLSNGKWLNLRSLKPDYVFYDRPYNNYLPSQYRSNNVSKYAKVCYIPYGIAQTWDFLDMCSRSFFRDIYLFYVDVKEAIDWSNNRFKRIYKRQLQKAKYLGVPGLSDFMDKKNVESESFSFSSNGRFRAIWTPRWTTDITKGGTNFFKYVDTLFSYAENNPDVDFLFRPHPLALQNFVNSGDMTKEEADAFYEKCCTSKNVCLDFNKEYAASFWNTNVLISDISSVIVSFFLTGKPLIYCKSDNKNRYFNFFQKILDCSYVVENSQELCDVLDELKKGNDPKATLRINAINEIFGNSLYDSAESIVKDISDDFYQTATPNKK